MFTLLAEQNRKYLYKQYRLRLLSVVALLCAVLFLIASALLLPSYIAVASDRTRIQTDTDTLSKQIAEKNSKGFLKTLSDIKSMVGMVSPDTTKILGAMTTILSNKPNDISFGTVSYTRGVGAPSTLTITGNAASRTDLIGFSKDLQKEPMFTSVSLPVSDLAKESDVNFTLTALGNF